MKSFWENLPKLLAEAAKSILGIFALMIICISILGGYFFSNSPVEIRVIIYVMMFVAVVIFGISIFKSIPQTGSISQTEITTKAAYGLKIKKNVWKHYYLENYDFEGEIEYVVENTSAGDLTNLLPVKAIWFGSPLKIPELNTKIYGTTKNIYNLTIDDVSEKSKKIDEIDGIDKDITSYEVQIEIKPPFGPKESLDYGIRFKTFNTERDAFNLEKGSWAGMGSQFPVDILECEIYAPNGYNFIDKGYQAIDQTGRKMKFENPPQFSNDGKKITWVVKNPSPTLRYLVKIFIAKTN